MKARADGLILHSLAVHGDATNPRYAGVWLPNTAKTIWDADGVSESGLSTRRALMHRQLAGAGRRR